jgi:hypothetical protein
MKLLQQKGTNWEPMDIVPKTNQIKNLSMTMKRRKVFNSMRSYHNIILNHLSFRILTCLLHWLYIIDIEVSLAVLSIQLTKTSSIHLNQEILFPDVLVAVAIWIIITKRQRKDICVSSVEDRMATIFNIRPAKS